MFDAAFKGPEIIDIPMTGVMIGYSSLFMRFAYMVQPRNYLLFACHSFNVAAQLNQLRRAIDYKLQHVANASEELTSIIKSAAGAGAMLAACLAGAPAMQAKLMQPSMPSFVRKVASHPAGPFTVFFWAPTSKWCLSGD